MILLFWIVTEIEVTVIPNEVFCNFRQMFCVEVCPLTLLVVLK